jgi:hypothetical protein
MDDILVLFELAMHFKGTIIELQPEDFYQGEVEMPKPETRCLYTINGETIYFGEFDGFDMGIVLMLTENDSRIKTHCNIADIEVCLEFFNRETIDLSLTDPGYISESFSWRKREGDTRKYELLSSAGFVIDAFEYSWQRKLFADWLVASNNWSVQEGWLEKDYNTFQNILTKFKYNVFPLLKLLPPQYRKLCYWQRVL